MKKMQKLLALMLVLMMIAGVCGALAEETQDPVELGDLQQLDIFGEAEEEVPVVNIEYVDTDGNIDYKSLEQDEATITAGDIEKTDSENYEPALTISVINEQVSVTAGDVVSNNDGVNVVNTNSEIQAEVNSVTAEGTGVRVTSENTAWENGEESDEDTFNAFLETNGEKAHFFDGDYEEGIFDRFYWAEGSEEAFIVHYEWNSELKDYDRTFQKTERPKSEGTTSVTVTEDVEASGQEQDVFGVYAGSNHENQDISITVQGDVTAEVEGKEASATAVRAVSGDAYNDIPGGKVVVEVDGTAAASGAKYGNYAVDAESNGKDSTVVVTVEEGAEGSVRAKASEGGETKIRIEDGITAERSAIEALSGEMIGEYGDGLIKGGTVTVEVEGNVTSKESDAISSWNVEGETNITVDGAVTAEGKGTAIDLSNNDGKTTVTVTGTVTGGMGSEDGAGAIHADNYGGSTTVNVKGDVKTTGYADAVIETENAKGTVSVAVDGNVTSTNGDAIRSVTHNEAKTDLEIGGDISATGKNGARALSLEVEELGTVTVTVSGETVSAKGQKSEGDGFTETVGISMTNNGGSINAVVDADVTASGADENTGIILCTNLITDFSTVGEPVDLGTDITNSQSAYWGDGWLEDGEFFEIWEYNGELYKEAKDGKYQKIAVNQTCPEGTMDLTVTGDVTADDYGAVLMVGEEQTASIIVDGTLKGDEAAIVINSDDTVIGENVDLTVWKLEAGEENTPLIISYEESETGERKAVEQEKAEKAVHYIVKVMGNWASTLAFKNIKTSNTVKVKDNEYHTALEAEDVQLKIDLAEGETLDGIYYDEDTLLTGENLKQDSEGNYLVSMLRGGGMMLGLKTHKHDYSVFVETVEEPTCVEAGTDLYKCSICGATQKKTVPATGKHTEEVVPGKEATCKETGLTEGKKCSVCKATLVEQEEIEKKAHTEATIQGKEATCKETGLTEGKKCAVCGEILEEQQEIEKKAHTEATIQGKEATCKETGLTEGKKCSACGEILVEQKEIEKKDHTPGKPVKEKEKPARSYEEAVYCETCGIELSRETVTTATLPKKESEENGKYATADSLDDIDMPKDVTSDDEDVVIEKLSKCPDAIKATAKQELASLKRDGYTIDCGFGGWSKSGKTASCTIRLSEKDVPNGSQIIVNGAAVNAELKDGYYYFPVKLPAIVYVAHN